MRKGGIYEKQNSHSPLSELRTVLYSDNPRDKLTVTVRAADESYHGKAMLCGKCKTMLAVIEKPKVARGYVAIPVTSATF